MPKAQPITAEYYNRTDPNAASGYGAATSIFNSRALRQLIEAHDLPHYPDAWYVTTIVTSSS